MSKFTQLYTTFSEKPRIIEAEIKYVTFRIDNYDYGYAPRKSYIGSIEAQNMLTRLKGKVDTKATIGFIEKKCYDKGDIYPPLVNEIYKKDVNETNVDLGTAINYLKRFVNPEGNIPKVLMDLKMRYAEREICTEIFYSDDDIKCVRLTLC